MNFTKLYVSDIMAKYHYTEAEAKAFIWGVKQSAAPDMYEALKEISKWELPHIKDGEIRKHIELALAKAEGKP